MNSFIYLCKSGNIETVKLLISKCHKLNYKDHFGNTPLHHACENGHFEIVKLLLDYGANINSKNNNGNTPLSILRILSQKYLSKF